MEEDELRNIDQALTYIRETLDLYDFTDLWGDILTLDDVRYALRDMFLHNEVPFPWEELAALAVIGIAKRL